jgi:hypothetical protein
VPLVLDLRITHDLFGSSSDTSINGHLHYPSDVDRSLNEAVTDKIRQYRTDYNNRPGHVPLTLSSLCLILLVRLGGYIVNLCVFYFYKLIGKLTAFLQLQEFILLNLPVASSTTAARRSLHSSSLTKSKVGNILAKAAVLRIVLNIDGEPIASKSHTHPSHSETSRLLTSSLSIGVPVPRATQCIRDV